MRSLGIYIAPKQHCFVVVKPGFQDLTKVIIERFEASGWKLNQIRTKQLLLKEAHRLYEVHKKEDFYETLCNYMASGPSTGIIFVRNRAVNGNEGFEDVAKIKEEIRKEYGESDMRNVLHSSDNLENMEKESSVYF